MEGATARASFISTRPLNSWFTTQPFSNELAFAGSRLVTAPISLYLKTVRVSCLPSSPEEHDMANTTREIQIRRFFITGIFLCSSLRNHPAAIPALKMQLLTVFLTKRTAEPEEFAY